jgi:hypothetical protein
MFTLQLFPFAQESLVPIPKWQNTSLCVPRIVHPCCLNSAYLNTEATHFTVRTVWFNALTNFASCTLGPRFRISVEGWMLPVDVWHVFVLTNCLVAEPERLTLLMPKPDIVPYISELHHHLCMMRPEDGGSNLQHSFKHLFQPHVFHSLRVLWGDPFSLAKIIVTVIDCIN